MHQYYDNTGAILFVGAGHSGKYIDVYQKLKKYLHPYFYAKQGKYGLINAQGDTLTPPIFNEYLPFSDGVAKIEIENKKGVIGEMGNVIIPAKYDFLEQGWKQSSDTYYVSRAGNFGILSKENRELVPFVYENIAPHYDFFYKLYKNNKVGIYIPKTNIHIPAIYDELKSENTEYQSFLVFKEGIPYIVDYYGYEYESQSNDAFNFSIVPQPQSKEAVYFEGKYYFPKLETGKKVIFYSKENKK